MTPTHAHGGEVYALARRLRTTPDKLLDFSSNANIFAQALTEELVRSIDYPFLHYPDSQAGELTEAIAAHEGLTPDRVLPGNGGADLIWLALRALAPRKALFLGPMFSEYAAACSALDIPYDILTPPEENDFLCTPATLSALWEHDADLVILCTPNNPATAVYDMGLLLQMVRAPRVLIDNSYREFLHGTDDYVTNSPHAYAAFARPGVSVVTLHSFTKFFCCPGIRLGYITGDRTLLARVASQRPAWTISPFAQQMGVLFLAHLQAYRESLMPLRAAMAHMGRELRRLRCFVPDKVFEGPGFLCCGLQPKGPRTTALCKTLLNQRILVRNCDSIPGMPEGFIRVQARPEADAARLLAVLECF